MTHEEAESRVKGVQKSLLCWLEDHPHFGSLHPNTFNQIRSAVFRGSFGAFRLGRIGLDSKPDPLSIWGSFTGWLDGVSGLHAPSTAMLDLRSRCFSAALSSFYYGACVQDAEE